MNRRHFLAGIGAGFALLIGAIVAAIKANLHYKVPLIGPNTDHRIIVQNKRDDPHQVGIEYDLNGESMTHGPWTIKPGEQWGVTTITDPGELTVRVSVDGDDVTTESHDVPTTGDSSAVEITLERAGWVSTSVAVDD